MNTTSSKVNDTIPSDSNDSLASPPAGAPARVVDPTTTIGGRFKKIETDRYMFNANKGSKILVGYLINLIPMAPIKGREWEAFVVKLTEPCLALDREKNLVEVPVGGEVLIPATHQLAQHFQRVATQPNAVYEVMIEPKKKIDIGAGQSMWTYELGANANAKSIKNRNQFGTAALLGFTDPAVVNALPAKGQTTAESIDTTAEEIPF